jgi:hypothetical protein
MSFLDALAAGEYGARFEPPDDFEAVEEHPRGARLFDPGRGCEWHIGLRSSPLALAPEDDALLRDDVERAARFEFEQVYAQLDAPWPGSERLPPRTDEPGWSPVVHCERVRVAGAPALHEIHRLAYEPGAEIIAGSVQIALGTHTLEFGITLRSGTTGLRESLLFTRLMNERPGTDSQDLLRELTQAQKDAPEHDALVPEHPLAVVRGGLRWLLAGADGRLTVSAPGSVAPAGETELPKAGCAITLPPRYRRFTPPIPMSPTLVMFARSALGRVLGSTIDVWRLPNVRIEGDDRLAELERLARRNAEEWASEGVTGLEVTTERLAGEGERAQVATRIEMVVQGSPSRSATRWIAEPDGAVFRLGAGGPPYLRHDELRATVDQLVSTFRRLPGDGAGVPAKDASPHRPWWKFW